MKYCDCVVIILSGAQLGWSASLSALLFVSAFNEFTVASRFRELLTKELFALSAFTCSLLNESYFVG